MNIKEHSQYPDISIDRHVKSRVVELGRALAGKQAVYLDIRYWILLRQAFLADDNSTPNWKLLTLLRGAVKGGKIFCPISETVFLELLKQSDPSSRLRTARLINELSLGVSLLSQPQRVATELAHFFYSSQNGADVYPLRHLVWTKLPYVLGFLHPTETAFDAETQLAIQKAFFDKMWTIELVQMIEMICAGHEHAPREGASGCNNGGALAYAHGACIRDANRDVFTRRCRSYRCPRKRNGGIRQTSRRGLADERTKYSLTSEALEREREIAGARMPGANDPCWCGSGKKYKNCHRA